MSRFFWLFILPLFLAYITIPSSHKQAILILIIDFVSSSDDLEYVSIYVQRGP